MMPFPVRRAHVRGFTLIELVVAVSILSILAVVAVPLYRSSANKSKRAECRSAVVLAMQNEERYFTNNNQYNTLSAIGSPAYSGNTQNGSACTLATYSGTVAAVGSALSAASPSVVVVATPNNWSDTDCNAGAYGLDNTGNFSPLTSALAAVASSSIPSNCF